MPYIYLISSVFFGASSSILGAFYNKKNNGKKSATELYNALLLSCVALFWLVAFLFDGTFDWKVLPYSILFAVCYTICNVGLINALKIGSVALTSLILQLSLIGVSAWGFLFWDAKFTPLIAFGLILVVIALWLCLYTGKKSEDRFSWKWLIFTLMAFAGNAGCSIVQKTQQMQFNGQYGNFLMMIAIAISAIICIFIYLCSDKTDFAVTAKTSWYFPVSAGICNALLNLFVIFLATSELSPSLIYPVLAIGGLMLTTTCSALIFKEKMRWWQWLGIGLGIISVGILSL